MAITTDSYVTINNHQVGLSKTINQVTLSDVESIIYSGYLDDKRNCNILPAGQNIPLPRLVSTTDSDSTVKVIHIGENYCATESSDLKGDGLYFRNVLLYMDNGYNFGGSAILFPDTYNAGHMHFITEIDIQELELVCNSDVNIQHTAGVKYYSADVTNGTICVAQVIKDSNDKFIIATLGGYNCDNYTRFNSPILYQPSYDMYYFRRYNYPSAGYLNIDKSSRWCFEPNLRYSLSPCNFDGSSYQAPESLAKVTLTSWGGTNFFDITMNDPETNNYIYYAWSGLKFTDGTKHYKPIVQNGYITGYTDDDTVKSEFDDWENITDHTTPSTPPSGGGTGEVDDELTEMPVGYIGGTAGMVSFIKINSDGLASADDISDAISRFDITTIGKDLLRNLISYKCFALLNIDDSVQRQIKIAGHGLTDENDHALDGVYIGAVAPVDFGDIEIPKLYEDFRDYAPYTRIEMYIPFCGWFDLPSWCMGRTVNGTIFTDLYNGTVKAVVYADNTVVAEVGGCCAYDIPFVADATGMKASAVISSALTTAAATGATIATPNVATGITAVTSAANTISAANANPTTLKGVMGDGSNLNGLLHIYVKITRPQSPTGYKSIPASYKHEYGIPCFKELTLTSGDGFTQVLDANITGTMTDREKQMIINGFRHGLIL